VLALAAGGPVCLVSAGGSAAGVAGRRRMLAPPRRLVLPSHLSKVRVALHSILYLPFDYDYVLRIVGFIVIAADLRICHVESGL
jgi:hypothetical protein